MGRAQPAATPECADFGGSSRTRRRRRRHILQFRLRDISSDPCRGRRRDEGQALVSGRLLADISRSLPGKPVDIASDDTKMELICGSARFTLQTLPVADYPSLPSMPEATGTVPSATFAQAVAQVVVAAGRDELLPVFTGVRVEIDDDTISLLATDRYRMALKELTWNPSKPQISATALVPARVLNETSRSMTAGEEVTLSLSDGGSGDGIIGFEGHGPAGERQTTTRLLDGEFPKVRHIMDTPAVMNIRVSTNDAIAAAKRVAWLPSAIPLFGC
jgi:DNA polymerase-3 subunit beta